MNFYVKVFANCLEDYNILEIQQLKKTVDRRRDVKKC